MKKLILASVIVSIGTALFAGGASAEVQEGKWSLTIVTKADGASREATEAREAMENMSPEEKAMMQKMMGNTQIGGNSAGMTTTTIQCVTNQNPVPEKDDQKNCQKTHTIDGNTVNFEVICDDSKSTGQVTYSENSMKGTIKSQQTTQGGSDVTIDITGEYVGPCSN